MKNRSTRLPRCIVAGSLMAAMVMASGCSDNSDLPRSTQTVEGMTIELGVIPAESVKDHAPVPTDPNSQHIVVALFDARGGERITDAQVRAGVGDRSYDHEPDATLEPMEIDGAMSYGSVFPMKGKGVWRIHVEIRRPGMAQPVEADFGYERVAS